MSNYTTEELAHCLFPAGWLGVHVYLPLEVRDAIIAKLRAGEIAEARLKVLEEKENEKRQ